MRGWWGMWGSGQQSDKFGQDAEADIFVVSQSSALPINRFWPSDPQRFP